MRSLPRTEGWTPLRSSCARGCEREPIAAIQRQHPEDIEQHGKGRTCAGTTLYSVSTPSIGAPRAARPVFSDATPKMCSREKLGMTRSPTRQSTTASPTAMISPAMSEPGTRLSFCPREYWPLATARSRYYIDSNVVKFNRIRQKCGRRANLKGNGVDLEENFIELQPWDRCFFHDEVVVAVRLWKAILAGCLRERHCADVLFDEQRIRTFQAPGVGRGEAGSVCRVRDWLYSRWWSSFQSEISCLVCFVRRSGATHSMVLCQAGIPGRLKRRRQWSRFELKPCLNL